MELTGQSLDNQIRRMMPVAAAPEERAQVEAFARVLSDLVCHASGQVPASRLVGPDDESIEVPTSLLYILERVAELMARGDAVTIVPVCQEVTTQQAADLLNVSRQYLVRLLDEGRIPFRRTGKHRRLRVHDVLTYKSARDRDRHAGLRELARLTQDFGGYDSDQV